MMDSQKTNLKEEAIKMLKDFKKESLKIISETKIYNEVEAQKIILFDFRTREQFKEGCFKDFSINIPYDEVCEGLCLYNQILEERTLEKFASTDYLKNCVNKCKRYFIAIIMSEDKIKKSDIYDFLETEGSSSQNYRDDIIKPLLFYKNLVNHKIREIGLYTKGFSLIKNKFPFLININMRLPTLFKGINGFHGFPSIVIDDRLYVGDQYHACSQEIISELKITHIVNATQHVPNLFTKNVKYCNVDIDDTASFKITPYLREVFYFIESAFMEDESEGLKEMKEDKDYKVEELSQVCGEGFETMNINDDNSNFDQKDVSSTSTFSECLKRFGELSTNENSYEKLPSELTLFNLQSEFDQIDRLDVKDRIMQKEFKRFSSKFKNNNRVLIHCSLGVSRSGSFVILYLMKKFGLRYDEALHLCRYHREQSSPMSGFAYELEDFEKNSLNFTFDY